MYLTVKYKDFYDQIVDSSEVKHLDRYSKCFYKDEELKKVEYYTAGQISYGCYYIEKEENEKEIIDQFFEKGFSSLGIRRKQRYGSYTIEKEAYFIDKILACKSQILLDKNNNEICFQDIDINTNEPIYFETEKHLYDSNNERVLNFEYTSDGSIHYIWGTKVYDARIFKSEGANHCEESIKLKDIDKYFPTLLKDNIYYRDATFLPEINTGNKEF